MPIVFFVKLCRDENVESFAIFVLLSFKMRHHRCQRQRITANGAFLQQLIWTSIVTFYELNLLK